MAGLVCRDCPECYQVDDVNAVCLFEFDEAWAAGEFHRPPLDIHPYKVLEWVAYNLKDYEMGGCDRGHVDSGGKCRSLKALYGDSDLISDSEVRTCLECHEKCSWLAHSYPTLYKAESLKEVDEG